MRKIVVVEWMSLDGVVQAPAYSDEDTSGGFKHGGWHLPYFDERSMKWVVDNVSGAGGFLFGRRTYDVLAAHWPNASEEEQALARPLNALPKYVASRTLKEPLAWQNSTLLGADIAASVRELRRQDGKPLLVVGSTELAATLFANDLVDELRLMTDPLSSAAASASFATMESAGDSHSRRARPHRPARSWPRTPGPVPMPRLE